MWLVNQPELENRSGVPDTHCQPLPEQPAPKQRVANFSYPRSGLAHRYWRVQQPADRDSRGSDTSSVPTVNDRASDVSAGDDGQPCASGLDLWESWHAKKHQETTPDYPALINSPGEARRTGFHNEPAVSQEKPPTTRGSSGPGGQSGQDAPAVVRSCRPEQQPVHAPKPPPKVSYSLFPPPDVSHKLLPPPLQIPRTPRLPGLEPSPISPGFSPIHLPENPLPGGTSSTMPVSRGRSSTVTTTCSGHGFITASSSDSIPLLCRSPGPSPPASQRYSSSSSEAPRSPVKPNKRSLSQANLRGPSLSKIMTRSTPSLANVAKAQISAQASDYHNMPPTPASICDRPLPPLPTERSPSPPRISVFETDSDDEDGDDDKRGSSEAKNFAHRFMHGLVHHRHSKREKSGGQDHRRSVSDEGPSSSKERHGGRTGLSRTLNAATRYRRSGPEESSPLSRGAVSMDLPRDRNYQPVMDEPEKSGKHKGARGSGEMLLDKILRRKDRG
ncbi:hypothetical protein C8A05DRAFT_15120 [Staphylotrichum tortipilum]|uniref:Uncharacterized protein n=1 Tax=Staphylotrichum tortipilum TaxID=2831512 RepID=A0AAN6MMW4_9PEZI|nr:hypothetical protein C8A05DRAFT_15120 [Staphylotrichum longicolle]